MNWGAYISIITLSCVKFMFSPALGPAFDLHWVEAYIAAIIGGLFSTLAIYYLSGYLKRKHHEKTVAKRLKLIAEGKRHQLPKAFSKRNKTIIRLKNRIPVVPFCLWIPYFLSIPVGTIICSKFYGKRKIALPAMLAGVILNGFISTIIVYFIKNG